MGNRRQKKALKIGISLVVITCVAAGLAYHFWFAEGYSPIDLWLTPDQQGRYHFYREDYAAAAERFQDPLWKGIAYYRSKNFEAAVEQFARVDTPQGSFNLGDAYAHLGRLEEAVTSYAEALRRQPDYAAARENRELVQSLIQKKKAKEGEKEPPEGQEPTFAPDEVKFDDKGKQGKEGETGQVELSAEQIQEVWMRRLQTTPSDFLRLKFAVQAEESETASPRGAPKGGR
jgi:Ca-activated chloride channel family protein